MLPFVVSVQPRRLKRGNGVGLVGLDGANHLPGADGPGDQTRTGHNPLGILEHQSVVGGDKRLALDAVDENGVDGLSCRG